MQIFEGILILFVYKNKKKFTRVAFPEERVHGGGGTDATMLFIKDESSIVVVFRNESKMLPNKELSSFMFRIAFFHIFPKT